MNIKIVFSDIDDTIMLPGVAASTRLKASIKKIQASGVLFVPITGRPFMSLANLKDQLGLTDYLCGYNGAIAYDIKNEDLFLNNVISAKQTEELIDYLVAENINFLKYDEENRQIVTLDDTCEYAKIEADLNNVELKKVDLATIKQMDSYKLLGLCDPKKTQDVIAKLKENFGEQFMISMSKPFFIEINKMGTNKGNCIVTMCEKLNINLDEVLCFGDSLNDLQMFEIVENSVAVSNAKPEILALSKFQTLSVKEDGFSHFIDEMFK